MDIKVKEVDDCTREMTITIDSKQALDDYNQVLDKLKKYVAVPGFRKGKAPRSLVERTYDGVIREEFLNQKLEEYYKQALKEEEVNPVNTGEAIDVDWEKGKDLTAIFKYEIMPEIKVKKYKDLKIPFEPTQFKEEMIEGTLQQYRENLASQKETDEPVSKGDIVEVSVVPLDDTSDKESTEDSVNTNDNNLSEEFNEKVIGKKTGDKFTSTLLPPTEENEETPEKFEVTINKVKKVELPELNDEFAKDLEYDSLEELKKVVATELKSKIEQENENRKRESIFQKLIEENPFQLPPSIVNQYATEMAKPYVQQYKLKPEDVIPMLKDRAENNLKLMMIIDKIKKLEDIKVTDEDIEEEIKKSAEKMDMEIDKYKELYKKQIESNEFKMNIEENKIIEIIENSSEFVPYPKQETEEKDQSEV